MKLTYLVTFLALAGCGSKKDKEGAAPAAGSPEAKPTEGDPAKPAEPDKPAPKATSGRAMPNSKGLVLDLPAKWEDNGIGGAAGFHLADDQGNIMMNDVSPVRPRRPSRRPRRKPRRSCSRIGCPPPRPPTASRWSG